MDISYYGDRKNAVRQWVCFKTAEWLEIEKHLNDAVIYINMSNLIPN